MILTLTVVHTYASAEFHKHNTWIIFLQRSDSDGLVQEWFGCVILRAWMRKGSTLDSVTRELFLTYRIISTSSSRGVQQTFYSEEGEKKTKRKRARYYKKLISKRVQCTPVRILKTERNVYVSLQTCVHSFIFSKCHSTLSVAHCPKLYRSRNRARRAHNAIAQRTQ